MKWDGTIGPASIVSALGALGVLVTMGMAWGTFTTKIEMVINRVEETKNTTARVAASAGRRDQKVAELAERLG